MAGGIVQFHATVTPLSVARVRQFVGTDRRTPSNPVRFAGRMRAVALRLARLAPMPKEQREDRRLARAATSRSGWKPRTPFMRRCGVGAGRSFTPRDCARHFDKSAVGREMATSGRITGGQGASRTTRRVTNEGMSLTHSDGGISA